MSNTLQAIVTLLALINPFVCATIFMRLEAGQSKSAQTKAALQVTVAVIVILSLAALFGAKLLHTFGISLDAFSVAGGGVLAWLGFSMISHAAPASVSTELQPSISPLILFAASPGTITGVITLAVAHSRLDVPVSALIAVAVGAAVMWLVLMLAIMLDSEKKSESGSGIGKDITSRLMGLIVLAMGVQFALTGLRAFLSTPS